MELMLVGPAEDFAEGGKRVVRVGESEIGIFRLGEAFHAWLNRCPHQGGPVCQGRIFRRVIEVVDADRRSHGRDWHASDVNIVCPWHGAEFDIRTGHHVAGAFMSLVPIPVELHGGQVYLRVAEDD